MASKTVLDVGNCGPDHASIKRMLTKHFEVELLQSHLTDDTLETLRAKPVDLVLINRKLDSDYSDGTNVLEEIKADDSLKQIPVMLVTNLEEHQQAAIELGAERGFGKLALEDPKTHQLLQPFLG